MARFPTFRIFPKPINQLLPSSVAVQTSPLLCSTLPQVKRLKRKLRNTTSAKNRLYEKLLSEGSVEEQCTLKQFLSLCDKFLPPYIAKMAQSEAKLYHKQKRKEALAANSQDKHVEIFEMEEDSGSH